MKLQKLPTREKAGRCLARRLSKFTRQQDAIVMALPCGGVAVGAEIASILGIPFDVLVVCKITSPSGDHEVLGAITSGGVRALNCALIDRLHLSDDEIRAVVLRESLELARRERLYRGDRPSLDVADRKVILVDDGSNSCATLRDAIHLLRRQHVDEVVVAMPAACHHAACDLRMEADELVTLTEPSCSASVGKWLKHIPRATEEEVCRLMSGVCLETRP